MIKRRKFLPFLFMLLMVSGGVVVAQSSTNFIMQRFETASGGMAESTNYKVSAVIGQPVTDLGDSSNYQVSDGFLFPQHQQQTSKLWLPLVVK